MILIKREFRSYIVANVSGYRGELYNKGKHLRACSIAGRGTEGEKLLFYVLCWRLFVLYNTLSLFILCSAKEKGWKCFRN